LDVRILKLLFVVLCSVLLACGYSFQGGGSVLPPEVQRIYVPDVVNRSSDPLIGKLLTEALRERFERYGVVQVVDSEGQSDAILRVRVQQIRSSSRSSTAAGDVAQQLSVNVTVAGELQQNSGVVLWKNPLMTVSRSFGNTSGAVVTSSAEFAASGLGSSDVGALNQRELSRSQQSLALEQIANDVAQRVYDEAVAPDF
jgi:outer membrane lipopolysaccharide assembly protein LptE/RlpB